MILPSIRLQSMVTIIVLLNFYDSLLINILFIENLVNYFGILVPKSLTTPKTDSFGQYLLLKTEFQFDTRVYGFQFYGQAAGTIQLRVIKKYFLLRKRYLL